MNSSDSDCEIIEASNGNPKGVDNMRKRKAKIEEVVSKKLKESKESKGIL
jgi:hypothetical protein